MWTVAECIDQVKRLQVLRAGAEQYLSDIDGDIAEWEKRLEITRRSAD